ncbi:MAG: CRISPR-associated helicase Cas3' [Lewinellaceae bacterium]|nr:CRISPR-associated helicase Cas3' [Phaeodactylibacter sp.]MCB9039790.1 CRISPR-associated helicase Cas3' [Lewinellaceae bacterium]
MEFFSHAETRQDKTRRGSKTMLVHTNGVREKAMTHFLSSLNFSYSSEQVSGLLHDVCQLHDLGKYTQFFQAYLLGEQVDPQKKSHARLGAYAIYEKWLDKDPVLAYWGYFLIKNHHTSLHWPKDGDKETLIKNSEYSDKVKLFQEQGATLMPHWAQITAELDMPNLSAFVKIPEYRQFRKLVTDLVKNRADIQDYFFLNYLFSLLIEADKLDASQTAPYTRIPLPADAVDEAITAKQSKNTPQNRLRQQVRAEVIRALEQKGILHYHLFTLTAPTGIGKTLTALDFALKLRDKIPGRPQIITALPFINIIEQTLKEYEKVLGDSAASILGHYQYADIFRDAEKDDENKNENDAERDYSQRRMQLNTWQSDVVVTSFVQLLQTLISNRNRMLLKFNHLANAIVIMDEVQNISLEKAPFIGSMIYYCARFLNTRFILMTATKPMIFELAQREIIGRNEKEANILAEIKELLPDPKRIYQEFNRTKIVPLLDPQLTSEDEFCALFAKHWQAGQSCLIVCNKVNRSLAVFNTIKTYLEQKKLNNPVYYLSTNVLPVDRSGVIDELKNLLAPDGPKPILVATQVVEAGIDLDFDCGFRDLGPIDAIVQVAGRINRENNIERTGSPLYVFDFGDCADVYSILTADQAKKALGKQPIEEPDYFDLVDTYFGKVADEDMVDYSEARARFKGVQTIYYTDGLNLKGQARPERIPVSDFQVIKNAPFYTTVFIEKSEEAKVARLAFLKMLATRDKEGKRKLKSLFDKDHRNVFQQHTLPVPTTYTAGLPFLVPDFPDLKILYVAHDQVLKWYEFPETGFKREQAKKEMDEQKKGLIL